VRSGTRALLSWRCARSSGTESSSLKRTPVFLMAGYDQERESPSIKVFLTRATGHD